MKGIVLLSVALILVTILAEFSFGQRSSSLTSHLTCVDNMCKATPGGGEDLCVTDLECTNWEIPKKISSTPHYSLDPSIALDSKGNLHVVWSDTGGGNEVFYTKLDKDGEKIVDDTRLTFNPMHSFNPSIAVDSSDLIHVAFTDARDGNAEIYYTRLDNEGNTLQDDFRVTRNKWVSFSPVIVVDSDENVHIVWSDNREKYDVFNLYYTKLSKDGRKLVNDIKITENEGHWSVEPSIALDSHDNIHIIWVDNRNGLAGGGWDIFYKKLDNQGKTIVDDLQLTYNTFWDLSPSIALDPMDNIHLAWAQNREDSWEIFYMKLNNEGNKMSERRLTFDPTNSESPYIAIDSNNNIHIVWTNWDQAWPTFNMIEIYYTKLNSDGDTIIDKYRLTTDLVESRKPSIAVGPRNDIHVVWQSKDFENDWDIYYIGTS